MNLMKKQEELLLKLHETNFAQFDGNQEVALSIIGRQLESFPNYVNSVIEMHMGMSRTKAASDYNDIRDYQETIQQLDTNRKSAHDVAISSIGVLNRLNERYGLKPFFDADTI